MAVDISEIVNVNGQDMPIRDVPYPLRTMFGYGHHPVYKSENRQVSPGDWPYTPDTCQRADEGEGIWLNPSRLVCPGCGLDCT